MKIIMFANPMTYGQELLSKLMAGHLDATLLPVGLLFAITVGMTALLIFMASRMVGKLPRGSR